MSNRKIERLREDAAATREALVDQAQWTRRCVRNRLEAPRRMAEMASAGITAFATSGRSRRSKRLSQRLTKAGLAVLFQALAGLTESRRERRSLRG